METVTAVEIGGEIFALNRTAFKSNGGLALFLRDPTGEDGPKFCYNVPGITEHLGRDEFIAKTTGEVTAISQTIFGTGYFEKVGIEVETDFFKGEVWRLLAAPRKENRLGLSRRQLLVSSKNKEEALRIIRGLKQDLPKPPPPLKPENIEKALREDQELAKIQIPLMSDSDLKLTATHLNDMLFLVHEEQKARSRKRNTPALIVPPS